VEGQGDKAASWQGGSGWQVTVLYRPGNLSKVLTHATINVTSPSNGSPGETESRVTLLVMDNISTTGGLEDDY